MGGALGVNIIRSPIGIRWGIPRAAEVRQTGLPNQTPIGDLIMFTPRAPIFTPRAPMFTPRAPMFTPRAPMFTPRAQREPLIKQPHVRFQTDLLGIQTPIRLGVKDPQLLPKNPPHPLLEKDIRLEEEQRRLEEQKMSNNERRSKEKEPEEPLL